MTTTTTTYSAHLKALSRAWREPPTYGAGGLGSLAIHHPTGILTAVSPLDAKNLKSSSTMYVLQCSCQRSCYQVQLAVGRTQGSVVSSYPQQRRGLVGAVAVAELVLPLQLLPDGGHQEH